MRRGGFTLMDLVQYERTKFALAAILRSSATAFGEAHSEIQDPFRDLFARLAEDRFNLVAIGRFSRGKTSLMNAMLGTERLPTGIVPLTSVITTVTYGSVERAFIVHQGRALPYEIELDALPQYITQQGNPENRRRVALAQIELPAGILRRGFHLVDTPGLGSSVVENSRTTERFLPQADAFLLVTSYDSPLSAEELRVLKDAAPSARRVFIAINKHDLVSDGERTLARRHLETEVQRAFGDAVAQIFSVSARDAIEARRHEDRDLWASSGVQALYEALTGFLLDEKQSRFLLGMCERIHDAIREAPNSTEERERLTALERELAGELLRPAQRADSVERTTADERPGFATCPICSRVERGIFDFLCKFQYDVGARREAQLRLATHGGLCPFHVWAYEAVASPRGTCIGFSLLLEVQARHLREIASAASANSYAADLRKLQSSPGSCEICRVQADLDGAAVEEVAQAHKAEPDRARAQFCGLCLPHLERVVDAVGSDPAAKEILVSESQMLERVSEDMRRYALKLDGVRRDLASAEETSADQRALMLLAGHRNLNGRCNIE